MKKDETEMSHGLDPKDPSNRNNPEPEGSQLEIYLNSLAGEFPGTEK